ncbi:PepSY domain-containing protein [Verrucosispora sp. WMMA2044]|uniref:PepSY domain-containing protein n=1 Tax=Verrucosispora sp. WMMA2044 TaxID=3016419 RepID=UPI00248C5648|nr:PepSY domain-containing protein [Verrucosispora sp. WMMA2044]WBB47387.1 PepSY domain-containing protein [Verrucosispora sp. WMMA2044]
MKRNPLILASVGGAAAVLAVAGAFLGVTAADDSRARQTTLTAATGAPTTAGVPEGTTGATAPGPTGTTATADPTSVAPSTPAQTQPATEGDAVSRERAGEIALAQAGGGRITETDRDEENGRAIWEVEIVNGGTEHEIDVDRQSGEIVKAEQEPADEDEDDRDEDDRDEDEDDRDDD